MLRRAILNTVTGSIEVLDVIPFTDEEIEGATDKLQTDPKKVAHILEEKHFWNRFNLDPKDPKDREKIIAIIQTVLASGTEEKYGIALKKSLEICGEIVEVTYKIIDGVLRISDAWVKRS